MSDLTEFLLARIAEDEQQYPGAVPYARWAAECEAKRRIVEHCDFDHLALSPGDPYVLQLLALPYQDHPDYRDEWRP